MFFAFAALLALTGVEYAIVYLATTYAMEIGSGPVILMFVIAMFLGLGLAGAYLIFPWYLYKVFRSKRIARQGGRVKCEISGERTSDLKQFRVFERLLYVGFFGYSKTNVIGAAPHAMRKLLLERMKKNIISGNFLTLTMLPLVATQYCLTFQKGPLMIAGKEQSFVRRLRTI